MVKQRPRQSSTSAMIDAELFRIRQEHFRKLYQGRVVIPTQDIIPGKYLGMLAREDADIFYRPATSELSYAEFKKIFGEDDDYNIARDDYRKQMHWAPIERGYWFIGEIRPESPQLGASWEHVAGSALLLEEYNILWHSCMRVCCGDIGRPLDMKTLCMLRTRFGESRVMIGNGLRTCFRPPVFRVNTGSAEIAEVNHGNPTWGSRRCTRPTWVEETLKNQNVPSR